MFENIGEKLKTVAKVILVLGVIIGIIGALVCLINLSDANTYEEIYYTVGLVSSIALIIGSVISAWLCYGVGEAAENSRDTLLKQEKIEQLLSANKDSEKKLKKEVEKWKCSSCGNMISKNPCPFCGNK